MAQHWYTSAGELQPEGLGYPSVTTILGVRNIPSLTAWKERTPPDEIAEKLHNSSDLGTRVHRFCEQLMKLGEADILTEDIAPYAAGFLNWLDKTQPTHRLAEQFLFSKKYGYAGTADLICRIDGEQWLIDFKTSKRMSPGMGLQLRAYEQAYYEMQGIHSRTGILQLTPKNKRGWSFKEYNEDLDVFLAHKKIFDWQLKVKEVGTPLPAQWPGEGFLVGA